MNSGSVFFKETPALMEKIIEESYRFKSLKPKVDYEFHEIIYAMF